MPAPLQSTEGKITLTRLDARKVRARQRVRLSRGEVVQVTAQGTTEARARAALREKVAARLAEDAQRGTSETVAEVATRWLAALDRQPLAAGTVYTYRLNAERSIIGSELAATPVKSVTVSRVHAHLQAISDERGAAEAKTTRSILRGVFDLAILDELAEANPARELPPLRRPAPSEVAARREAKRARIADAEANKRRRVVRVQPAAHDVARAFTRSELAELLQFVNRSEYAANHNLAPLVHVLAGTGCRMGEALALTWDDVDLRAGTMDIHGTAQRVSGAGMVVQNNTKTSAGMRKITIPGWLVDYLRSYRKNQLPASPYVCTSMVGTLRDPSNSNKTLRQLFTRAGFDWATAHNLRKTVATLLDEQGATAREIAAHLGHRNPSLTMDVYMDARRNASSAGRLLDGIPTDTAD